MAKQRVITIETIREDLLTVRDQIDQEVAEADESVTQANIDFDEATNRRDRVDEALNQLEDIV